MKNNNFLQRHDLRVAVLLIFLTISAAIAQTNANEALAEQILADQTMTKVDEMARELMKKGFYAGSGYQMVWARDLNTFIELSCDEYDVDIIRENLLMFFHFQQENGELLDGYVHRKGFTWNDPHPYESRTAPGHIGFKNTVETDQETSLVQAIKKYIAQTDDRSILEEKVAGKSVYQRLVLAIEYLLTERFSKKFGLVIGATTFDWGDVQVEGGAIIDVDENTHWSIDIYDNAMLLIALKDMAAMASDQREQQRWQELHAQIKANIRTHLWDAESNKFIPHVYLDASPFPSSFDENAIFYHGGTAVAMEADVLSRQEITAALEHLKNNVTESGATSIGLTVYPPYPEELLGANVSPPYQYQNGGDWTWFGGRLVQQLIAYGFVAEAYELAKPMYERVLENKGFFEWYTRDGSPRGSADFKGSAGVLAKSIRMFRDWARQHR